MTRRLDENLHKQRFLPEIVFIFIFIYSRNKVNLELGFRCLGVVYTIDNQYTLNHSIIHTQASETQLLSLKPMSHRTESVAVKVQNLIDSNFRMFIFSSQPFQISVKNWAFYQNYWDFWPLTRHFPFVGTLYFFVICKY